MCPAARGDGGITESTTDPPANLVGDTFGKQQPVGRCGGGSITTGITGRGWVGSCRFWSIITSSSTVRAKVAMRSKAAVN